MALQSCACEYLCGCAQHSLWIPGLSRHLQGHEPLQECQGKGLGWREREKRDGIIIVFQCLQALGWILVQTRGLSRLHFISYVHPLLMFAHP